MWSKDSDVPSYIDKVKEIEGDSHGNVEVHVRWYYRPKESKSGRQNFHAQKEMFFSDHFDVQSANTIEGKCIVHTLNAYTNLEAVGTDDYFYRFKYKATIGGFTPKSLPVYCTCEMPYNPNHLMLECKTYAIWFHRQCIGLRAEEAAHMVNCTCSSCLPRSVKKRNPPSHQTPDAKSGVKRQRR